MVSVKQIRENPDWFRSEIKKRMDEELLKHYEEFLRIDKEWRDLIKELDSLRRKRNEISELINKYKKQNKDVKELIEKARELPLKIKNLEEKQRVLEEKRYELMLLLPNTVDEDVPIGDETKNQAIAYYGKPRVNQAFIERFKEQHPNVEFEHWSKEILSHYDIVEKFNLVDSETAGKISGSRFYFEKNQLVMLDLAIIMHALEFYQKKGFTNVLLPPYLIKHDVEKKITHYDTFKEAIFHVKEDDLLLITTSEHPLAAMFMNKNISKNELPLRILAWSPAFRREAGSHGKDTKGIFRVKQFHKVELHSITELANDRQELDFIVKTVVDYMKELELPFRVVKLASGDIDKRARIQIDIETWFPSQNAYRETHSIATVGDWISTKLRIKTGNAFVANLYATGVAVQRTICALLENNYDAETKTITIPKCLHKFLSFKTIELSEKR
ncbi:serine--tRNA ligase [Candidatus Woesearchaeota archaeon]|nr:serine--tRNA ligase [Candidatus Woesearchaeota archaeon]